MFWLEIVVLSFVVATLQATEPEPRFDDFEPSRVQTPEKFSLDSPNGEQQISESAPTRALSMTLVPPTKSLNDFVWLLAMPLSFDFDLTMDCDAICIFHGTKCDEAHTNLVHQSAEKCNEALNLRKPYSYKGLRKNFANNDSNLSGCYVHSNTAWEYDYGYWGDATSGANKCSWKPSIQDANLAKYHGLQRVCLCDNAALYPAGFHTGKMISNYRDVEVLAKAKIFTILGSLIENCESTCGVVGFRCHENESFRLYEEQRCEFFARAFMRGQACTSHAFSNTMTDSRIFPGGCFVEIKDGECQVYSKAKPASLPGGGNVTGCKTVHPGNLSHKGNWRRVCACVKE